MSTIIRGLFALLLSAGGLLGTQRAAIEIVDLKHTVPQAERIDPPPFTFDAELVTPVVPTPISSVEIRPPMSYGDEYREPIGEFSWSEETTGGNIPAGLTVDPNWDAIVNDPSRTEPAIPSHSSSRPEWRCDAWMDLARQVGWAEEQLPRLSYTIYRESRCFPDRHNPDDPMGGSNGLTQINQFWCKPTRYWPDGWLQTHGILEHCDDLYIPEVSLTASLAIWENSGWSPWFP